MTLIFGFIVLFCILVMLLIELSTEYPHLPKGHKWRKYQSCFYRCYKCNLYLEPKYSGVFPKKEYYLNGDFKKTVGVKFVPSCNEILMDEALK